MGSLSIWHWLVVIVVVLLLFGRGKISDLMGDVAQGIKAFKKGMADDDKAEAAKTDEVKSIDHQPGQDAAPSQTEKSKAPCVIHHVGRRHNPRKDLQIQGKGNMW